MCELSYNPWHKLGHASELILQKGDVLHQNLVQKTMLDTPLKILTASSVQHCVRVWFQPFSLLLLMHALYLADLPTLLSATVGMRVREYVRACVRAGALRHQKDKALVRMIEK